MLLGHLMDGDLVIDVVDSRLLMMDWHFSMMLWDYSILIVLVLVHLVLHLSLVLVSEDRFMVLFNGMLVMFLSRLCNAMRKLSVATTVITLALFVDKSFMLVMLQCLLVHFKVLVLSKSELVLLFVLVSTPVVFTILVAVLWLITLTVIGFLLIVLIKEVKPESLFVLIGGFIEKILIPGEHIVVVMTAVPIFVVVVVVVVVPVVITDLIFIRRALIGWDHLDLHGLHTGSWVRNEKLLVGDLVGWWAGRHHRWLLWWATRGR